MSQSSYFALFQVQDDPKKKDGDRKDRRKNFPKWMNFSSQRTDTRGMRAGTRRWAKGVYDENCSRPVQI